MQTGRFEPVETALLQRCMDRATVFIDVGANVGFYSCLARSVGKHTVAIEPVNDNLRYLYRNLRANGWNDVEVWPLAVGARPGLMTLYGAKTGASLVPGWAGVSSAYSRTTAVSTLDLIVGSRFDGHDIVIKVDVEGAEYEVLQGAKKLLSCTPKPVWLVEILRDLHRPGGNPDFHSTFELMRSAGYNVFKANAALTPVSESDVADMMANRQQPDVISWVFSADRPVGG